MIKNNKHAEKKVTRSLWLGVFSLGIYGLIIVLALEGVGRYLSESLVQILVWLCLLMGFIAAIISLVW